VDHVDAGHGGFLAWFYDLVSGECRKLPVNAQSGL
jgi:hypothetical protein